MKYKLLNGGNPGSRDVTAFYGLNRTGAISDFQLSDMENMDCEDFPYVKTRRSRMPFWGTDEEQPAMEMICSDTDVYDDYKVTGITKEGGFVYRGETLLEGGYSGNTDMIEFMGDYVFFPSKKVVTAGDGIAAESEFHSREGGFLGDGIQTGYSSIGYTPSVGLHFRIDSSMIHASFDSTQVFAQDFCTFFFHDIHPGQAFTLDLLCRYGKSTITREYKCDIPEDVYMVVDKMYYEVRVGSATSGYSVKRVLYGDEDFDLETAKSYYESRAYLEMYISFTARSTRTGEPYDISPHFMYYHASQNTVTPGTSFLPGLAYVNLAGDYSVAWNDFHINFVTPAMLFGASYGGRLFTCDNLGVTVYGSSAVDRYDFEATGSSGGAVFLSCADPGKWTAIYPYGDALYVFKRNGMYRIYSGDGLTFYMDRIADVGAIGKNSVCVVDDVMYFLSDEGLYQFAGAYPQLLPNALGKRYVRGTLGGDDRKLFASLTYEEGGEEKTELIVYHADKQIYSRHDDFAAKQFLVAMGGVYALAPDGVVYQMEGERNSLSFSLTTKKYFFGFSKKAANAARIFFTYEPEDENDSFLVEIAYDDGAFEPCGAPIKNGRARYVPIRFRKCDEFTLKVSGKGVFALKGLSFAVYQGGDIKQNHLIK